MYNIFLLNTTLKKKEKEKKRETDTRTASYREKAYKDTRRMQPFTSQEERSQQKLTLTTP